jgi:hypothetical protein
LKDSWLFPVVQSVHLVGLALLVGTIVLVDLSVLGLGSRRNESSPVASHLAPWTLAGFALMGTTGTLLFLSDIPRYLHNPAFLLKVLLLVFAGVNHFTVHRAVTIEQNSAPVRLRLLAVLSLLLWTGVVLAARAIADFDIRTT